MATTKDVTKEKQALTEQDVNSQDARTRLWQSFNTTYQNQIDQSNKSFEDAYSQADRQALSRGMGRSSYTAQTLANINKQKIDAQNRLGSEKIAAYQNALNTLDQEDRQFAATWVQSILANGGDPSDDLLARAGLSRADANAMKYVAPVVSGGGGGGGGGTPKGTGLTTKEMEEQLAARFANGTTKINVIGGSSTPATVKNTSSSSTTVPYGAYKTAQLTQQAAQKKTTQAISGTKASNAAQNILKKTGP